MKIIAFAGSNSSRSINKQLATYVARLFTDSQVEILDLNDYEMPIYSADREALGYPELAKDFLDKLKSAEILVLSLAENNGNYSTAFKNIFDWCSRIEKEVFRNTPMLLMAASPGARGGKSVLEIAENNLPRYGGNIRGVFSFPDFGKNFDRELGKITNIELDETIRNIVYNFERPV